MPPKAKEFDSVTEVGCGLPCSGTMSSPLSLATGRTLVVGGSMSWWIASTEQIASTAPAAPRVCPVIDFVELTGGVGSVPSSNLTALGSTASLVGVPVPCMLM